MIYRYILEQSIATHYLKFLVAKWLLSRRRDATAHDVKQPNSRLAKKFLLMECNSPFCEHGCQCDRRSKTPRFVRLLILNSAVLLLDSSPNFFFLDEVPQIK
jgi:hypothetical protein